MTDPYMEQAIGIMKYCGPALKEYAHEKGLDRRDYIHGKSDLGWLCRGLYDGMPPEAVMSDYLLRVATAMKADSVVLGQPYRRDLAARLAEKASRISKKAAKPLAAVLVLAGLSGCLAYGDSPLPAGANCTMYCDFTTNTDGNFVPQGDLACRVDCSYGDYISVQHEADEIGGNVWSGLNFDKGKVTLTFRVGSNDETKDFNSFSEAWQFINDHVFIKDHTSSDRVMIAPADRPAGDVNEYKGFYYTLVSKPLISEESGSGGDVKFEEKNVDYYGLYARIITWDESGERHVRDGELYFRTEEELKNKIDQDQSIDKLP